MSKPRDKYTVRVVFEGEDLEILLKVMAYHRISSAKDLLMYLVAKEHRKINEEIKDKGGI